MKLKNDVRPRIGRFFILVVSVTSNESIVGGRVTLVHSVGESLSSFMQLKIIFSVSHGLCCFI